MMGKVLTFRAPLHNPFFALEPLHNPFLPFHRVRLWTLGGLTFSHILSIKGSTFAEKTLRPLPSLTGQGERTLSETETENRIPTVLGSGLVSESAFFDALELVLAHGFRDAAFWARDGWRVNADGSFAFKRGRWGTVQISGTVRTPLRKRRYELRRLRETALVAFRNLFQVR